MTTRQPSNDDASEIAQAFIDEVIEEAAQAAGEEAARAPSAEAQLMAARGRAMIERMAATHDAPVLAFGSADDLTPGHDGSRAAIPISFLANLAARSNDGAPGAVTHVAVTRVGCDEPDDAAESKNGPAAERVALCQTERPT